MEQKNPKDSCSQTEKESRAFRIEGLFQGWFHNHMTILLLAIQDIRGREARSLMKIRFFLEDLEHHYLDSSTHTKKTNQAFRYLNLFFLRYPRVKIRHCHTAFRMVKRLYQAVDLEPRVFSVQSHFSKPKGVSANHGIHAA